MLPVNVAPSAQLAGFLHIAKVWGEAALILAIAWCCVNLLMSYLDNRRALAEREAQRESSYWRTVRSDPRASRR